MLFTVCAYFVVLQVVVVGPSRNMSTPLPSSCIGAVPHGGLGETLVPPHTRGSVPLSRGPGRRPGASSYTRKRPSLTGAWARAWCVLIHAEASPSHGGQGESLVPPHTRGSVPLSRGPGRKPGASSYTQKRLPRGGAVLLLRGPGSQCSNH